MVSYGLQIVDYRLQIADCKLQIADCRLQIFKFEPLERIEPLNVLNF